MENKTIVELFALELYEKGLLTGNGDEIQESLECHKQMEKEQKEALYTKEEVASAMLQISEYITEAVDLDATQSDELEPFVKAQAKEIIKSLKTK